MRAFVLCALAAVLAGCAGNGTLAPALSTGPRAGASSGVVRVDITFPALRSANAARRPAYLSPSLASVTIAVNGGATTVVNAPPPASTSATVSTIVPAPVGSDTFVIAAYDATGGTGKLLGRVTKPTTVVAGIVNNLSFTIDGQLAKIAIVAPNTPFVEGNVANGVTLVGDAPERFVAIPEDADGNTIVAPGAVPNLRVASAAAAIVVAPNGDGSFTLAAPAPTTATSISVTGTDLDGKTIAAPLSVAATGAFYIADYTVQAIRVFDETGTPLALGANAFANVTNPEGLAYRSGTPGTVIVTETSNPGAPYVVAYDAFGNAQPLAAGAFGGMSRPLFATYAPAANGGTYFVPDYFTNSVSAFDATGSPIALASGSFAGLLNPVAAVYDPHDAQVYVSSGGNDTIKTYTSAGALKGSATVGSHPMGVAYDANNASIYVAFDGTMGAATDGQSAQVPGITQFNEALAPVSNTGGFANTSTSTLYTGIAYDPYTKQIYAADAGNSKIVAFTESGTPVVLPAGAFATISATTSPKADPMAILFVP